jgi:hypothetical protein
MKTLIRPLLLIPLLLFLNSFDAFAQEFNWAKGFGGGLGNSISLDPDGNSYTIGSFQGAVVFDTIQFTSYGLYDIFITKYDHNGKCIWAKQAGGSEEDYGTCISVDAAGNSFITGTFYLNATFGTIHLSSADGYHIFIAKYDKDGNCLWAKQAGSIGSDAGFGISTDMNGNFYLTGTFQGTAVFDTIHITSYNNSQDIFLAKYNSAGNCLWAKHAGGNVSDNARCVVTDAFGNCYITGSFIGPATFGNIQVGGYAPGGFVAKYDSAGNCLWAKLAGNNYVLGISVDTARNCYVTGNFNSSTSFGSIGLTSYGGYDGFVAKYDPSGTCLWAKQIGSITNDYCKGLIVDKSGNSYLTGYFSGAASFGSFHLTSFGSYDVFVAKYDAGGNCVWTEQAGGPGDDEVNGISVDAAGNRLITGSFTGNANFGTNQLSGGGAFIANFAVTPLVITSPVGFEIWQTNSSHNITWNCNDDGNIKIEISTNNGTDWMALVNSIKASLGNYTLTVPPFQTSGACRIKLSSLSYGNSCSSPDDFTITTANTPYISVISPGTSVKWRCGSTQNISWYMTGSVQNLKLEYTTDNGKSWIIITNSTPASQGYQWVVPNTPSTSCRVRVSDVANPRFNDVSDELFSINLINIALTSPNGGEILKSGAVRQITWNSVGVSNINIYISWANDVFDSQVAVNVPAASGSYSWTVPGALDTNCKLKLYDASDPTVFSVSKNPFTIWQPVYSIQTPGLGNNTQFFDITNISFSSFVLVSDAITATWYSYESPAAGTLPNGVAVVSKYYWTITSPAISFINGAIRVPVSKLRSVTDSSKLVWLKRTNSGDAWTNIGGTVSLGNLISTVYFTSFSQFAIGSTDSSNSLPVEISSFTYESDNYFVKLKWITQSEINNDRFEIERRSQDLNWIKIGEIKGAGNSTSPLQYSCYDKDALLHGKYFYRLKQVDYNGQFKYSQEIEVIVNSIPKVYSLENNFPNPFNPVTIIRYSLPFESNVKLAIYNAVGQAIKNLISEVKQAGNHEIPFNASILPSGIYFYSLQTNSVDGKHNYTNTKKMILIK